MPVKPVFEDILARELLGSRQSRGNDRRESNLVREREVKVCECVPSQVVRCVSELIKYAEDPDPLKTREVITTLGQLLKGHVSSKDEMLWNMDSERWKRTSLVERKEFIETVSLELILTSDSWAKDWKDQRCTCNDEEMYAESMRTSDNVSMAIYRVPDASADESKYMVTTGMKDKVSITNCWIIDGLWIVQNIFPLVQTWEWGTTSNFLFKIQDTNVPSSMASKEKIHLVDAGLKINSPYPPRPAPIQGRRPHHLLGLQRGRPL
ncbi:uncharacterized protein LOC115194962 [Salmo trutta]|uniref:uncharacterized protein LOC115194962 n=1 Tax=Salmo trutta TaxID=8032 RepID=UPI0011309F2A|nr:uncharacterized protein LOC115194962 [Salmo trutta]